MYEHPYAIVNFIPPVRDYELDLSSPNKKVGREDVNRLVLVCDCSDQSRKIICDFCDKRQHEVFGALLLFYFFCLQGLEQPEICRNDRTAGMAGKLK